VGRGKEGDDGDRPRGDPNHLRPRQVQQCWARPVCMYMYASVRFIRVVVFYLCLSLSVFALAAASCSPYVHRCRTAEVYRRAMFD
jgi:hypothetical protein